MSPKIPGEVLTIIQDGVDDLEFADDKMTTSLNSEIQEIFSAIRMFERGCLPKLPLWISDGCEIGFVLDDVKSERSKSIVSRVGKQLGIELTITDIWEEAALRLRIARGKSNN